MCNYRSVNILVTFKIVILRKRRRNDKNLLTHSIYVWIWIVNRHTYFSQFFSKLFENDLKHREKLKLSNLIFQKNYISIKTKRKFYMYIYLQLILSIGDHVKTFNRSQFVIKKKLTDYYVNYISHFATYFC